MMKQQKNAKRWEQRLLKGEIVITREDIFDRLRKNGCRLTKQRVVLIDVILENGGGSCKEIYYQAVKRDKNIGISTVYRVVRELEKMGVISREYVYRLEDSFIDKNSQ